MRCHRVIKDPMAKFQEMRQGRGNSIPTWAVESTWSSCSCRIILHQSSFRAAKHSAHSKLGFPANRRNLKASGHHRLRSRVRVFNEPHLSKSQHMFLVLTAVWLRWEVDVNTWRQEHLAFQLTTASHNTGIWSLILAQGFNYETRDFYAGRILHI